MIADYRILGPAGHGASGIFYYAVPPARLELTTDRVLLKVVQGAGGDDTFRKIARELRTFASVGSPYLVRLFDAGQDNNSFYYSMESPSLGTLATPARPLTRHEVITAVRHAALAAEALHEAGLAHRDIQPSTVHLHEGGGKLADLGLASTINPEHTVTGMAGLEAAEYVDPVILYGGRPSRQSDIFSLGATLHRALTGEGFYGYLPPNEPLLTVRRILSGSPKLSSGLLEDEARVINACIDQDVKERYRTAADLAADLSGLIGSADG